MLKPSDTDKQTKKALVKTNALKAISDRYSQADISLINMLMLVGMTTNNRLMIDQVTQISQWITSVCQRAGQARRGIREADTDVDLTACSTDFSDLAAIQTPPVERIFDAML
ncbi:MAG: hypothetical protein HQK60_04290 [Deltaproteobacteria bacterium]|nr:hypothetical protein [Deltaproteobacteria bacterium]